MPRTNSTLRERQPETALNSPLVRRSLRNIARRAQTAVSHFALVALASGALTSAAASARGNSQPLAQGAGATAASQESAPEPRPLEVVKHFIRPGDTFSQVTQKLLGTSRGWQRNSELNPEHEERSLRPGERMLVLIDPERHPSAARVERRAGRVEGQPSPLAWTDLALQDLLLENDATRTGEGSSAQLVFGDGVEITVSENSLMLLRKLNDRLTTVDATEVEVVSGQADLALRRPSSAPPDKTVTSGIDVVLGSAKLQIPGRLDSQVRTGLTAANKSKASVYQGAPAGFSNAGQRVELPSGTGVAAAPNEAPRPEKLIAAPSGLEPADAARIADDRPVQLSWQIELESDQSHASSVVEVCADRSCGELVRRLEVPAARSAVALDALPRGTYFWRVNAISAQGVDGFLSPARSFVVEAPGDRSPPHAELAVVGRTVPFNGVKAYGGAPQFEVQVGDDGSGVESWRLMRGEQPLDELRRAGLLPTGRHEVSVEVRDAAGNVSRSASVTIDVEGSAPIIRLEPAPPPAQAAVASRTLWSIDGIAWRALTDQAVSIMSSPFELYLAAPQGHCLREVATPGDSRTNGCDASLVVQASDPEVGMRVLRAVAAPPSATVPRFELHALDHAQNPASVLIEAVEQQVP